MLDYCDTSDHDSWMCPTVICEISVSVQCEFCGGTDHESLKCRSNAMANVRKLYPSQQLSNEVMDEENIKKLVSRWKSYYGDSDVTSSNDILSFGDTLEALEYIEKVH